MAEKRHLHHLGLIILWSFVTGTTGVDETHEFCSSGGSVRLPCNDALSDCTSTTWIYSRHSKTVELITSGKKKTDTERHERLSLGSDCSLNINKVTKEDYGSYSCRRYVNGQQYGSDARVYLHFLHVSPSSSQIRSGNSVTLFCQLYYDRVSCDTLVRADGVQLIWENQAGVNLQTDSRYQILFSSGHCNSTLTTTLLDEDNNQEWRCLITQRNQVKTSATYIVRYSGTSTTNTSTPNTSESQVTVIVMSVLAAVLIVALVSVLWVIYTKRARNKGGADISVDKDRDENKGTYEFIKISIPTTPNTNVQTADVIYSEVTASSKKQVNTHYIDSNDTVTYAAIRGTKDAPQDGLYASVNTTTPHK
ncbi:uncharacterized protein LOC113116443 isoform X2 [Carassius auratus]|uniref:Uncharacterized protein LOC113116443 isoform X2 n=1 Tax=Carassius auratus TaxID=7957 RepID=A0A6P6R4J9_CARAU|nr:uncharacterized protein LOC113116443 isoform X2 [Carassius auratus]